MKSLLKLVLQFPAAFFLFSGVERYVESMIPQLTVFILALFVYDMSERFLSGP